MRNILVKSAIFLVFLGSNGNNLYALSEELLFSPKSMGRAGAVVADPIDTLVGAYNPAGMAFLEDRFDLGLTWYQPSGESTIRGNLISSANGTFDNENNAYFLLPDFGIHKRMCTCHMGTGFLVYTRRHFTTNYDTNIELLGTSNLKFEYLMEVFSPVFTYRFSNHHAAGVSVDIMVARLKTHGLEVLDRPKYSLFPDRVTNVGHDYSYGFGVTLGWITRFSDCASFGVSWQPQVHMSKFGKYKGLINRAGCWHSPMRLLGGIAVKPVPVVTVELDLEYIHWGAIPVLNDHFHVPGKREKEPDGDSDDLDFHENFKERKHDHDDCNDHRIKVNERKLGGRQSPGFGWSDHVIFRLGGEWKINNLWTVRGGYRREHNPIKYNQTFFNLLIADVTEEMFSAGATYTLDGCNEISGFYAYVRDREIRGDGSIPRAFGGGEADLKMHKNVIGLSWGHIY